LGRIGFDNFIVRTALDMNRNRTKQIKIKMKLLSQVIVPVFTVQNFD